MRLSELTTLRVGGDAEEFVAPATRLELIETARRVWVEADEWLAVGGGSNLVASDDPFPGTVIRIVTRGIERLPSPTGVLLRVQAGESWDELVAFTVDSGLAGIEALAGIPGSCGAAPIQNIGAYGQEISDTLVGLEFLDYLTGELVTLSAHKLGFGYRRSALKGSRAGIVLSIDLLLTQSEHGLSEPLRYPQLATALGVELGARLPLTRVREAVLALRSAKGMVLDAADPDSVSAGSFFTNPIVSDAFARTLPVDVPRWVLEEKQATLERPAVKLSAAWLIEHCGVARGFGLPGSGAAISSKHSLAIVNTGGATANQVAELARYVQTRVLSAYGVVLQPEPVLIGVHV